MARPKEIPEFHQEGTLSIENLELVQEMITKRRDVGLMMAQDGRIWMCVDGIAFVRFSPWPNGRMAPD